MNLKSEGLCIECIEADTGVQSCCRCASVTYNALRHVYQRNGQIFFEMVAGGGVVIGTIDCKMQPASAETRRAQQSRPRNVSSSS